MLLLAAAACRQAEDTRYFAPAVEFGKETYAVTPAGGGLDIDLLLSRPATLDFSIGLVVTSSLEENVQFSLSSHAVHIAAGEQSASIHVDLMDDEIWVESSWIELLLVPGERYTIDPEKSCAARIDISKAIDIPIFQLTPPEEPVVTNPFLAEILHFQITADRQTSQDMDIDLDFGDLVYGEDYLIKGSQAARVTYPAGFRSHSFDLQILKKDQSGYDKEVSLSLIPNKGKYSVNPDLASILVHLSDPVVDFSKLLRTSALQNGEGYQVRQAILAADGSWEGNTTVDLGRSAEGSNYLRNYRNMYDHPSFGCRANASVSQMFRLGDLMPRYQYPNDITILDYGNDQGHREFSPADSVMRFVLDRGETAKGKIYLERPRRFIAFIGPRANWTNSDWPYDSKATGGDIFASTNPNLLGTVSVTLMKLEGSFDFTDSDAPVLLDAWFQSDSEMFMKADAVNGKDPAGSYAVSCEDGLWKVSYKLWPR